MVLDEEEVGLHIYQHRITNKQQSRLLAAYLHAIQVSKLIRLGQRRLALYHVLLESLYYLFSTTYFFIAEIFNSLAADLFPATINAPNYHSLT